MIVFVKMLLKNELVDQLSKLCIQYELLEIEEDNDPALS
jgi:hypothetical protein